MTCRKIEKQRDGFRVLALSSEEATIEVVPELGAKISSLFNLRSGREWCWRPNVSPELFANRYGDLFENSPHVGIDECFPTIAACEYAGRTLPCHGEVWSRPWLLDETAWQNGVILTTISAPPFHLARKLILDGPVVRISYELTNQGATRERYLWAFHPMFRIVPEDRLVVPAGMRAITVEEAEGFPAPANGKSISWPDPASGIRLDHFHLGDDPAACVKLFSGPLKDGFAAVENQTTGERLEMRWDSGVNSYLGVWINRGGYRGIRDVMALEPTNAPTDSLASANEAIPLEPGDIRRWELSLCLANRGA